MTVLVPPLVPGAGPRPVRTRDDVARLFPSWVKDPVAAPVRDALVDALTSLLLQHEFRAEIAAAQSDELRATRQYLLECGSEQGITRQPGEGEEAFRERMFAVEGVATEEAITVGVNAILAPFTSKTCQLVDSILDQYFVQGAGAQPWRAFLGASPLYPERLYPKEAAENEGLYRPHSDPLDARFFNLGGCEFCLLVPSLGITGGPFIGNAPPTQQMFIGNAPPEQQAYHYGVGGAADAVYRAIASFVDPIAGQSVRWTMIASL